MVTDSKNVHTELWAFLVCGTASAHCTGSAAALPASGFTTMHKTPSTGAFTAPVCPGSLSLNSTSKNAISKGVPDKSRLQSPPVANPQISLFFLFQLESWARIRNVFIAQG